MGSPVSAVDINVMYRLTLAVFVSLALAVRAEPPSPCHGFFTGADFGATLEAQCSPIYGHFVDHTSRIHHLTNEHLRHSIFFSMMSSFFKSDTPNRAGFSKYMEAMADKMWDDAVELIKYAGMRGVFMKPEAEGPYNTTGLQFSLGSDPNIWTSGWRGSNLEVEAMSLALTATARWPPAFNTCTRPPKTPRPSRSWRTTSRGTTRSACASCPATFR